MSGLPLFRGTFADPSAEKDRDKSVTVEFASRVQPVPPAAVPGVPFRPVVLEGLTVQRRAEASGQAKWITWVVRATGMRPVGAATHEHPSGCRQVGQRLGPGRAEGSVITVRPSREAVARWNTAYAEQTAAMFAAMRTVAGDVATVRRLARSYLGVAHAWRVLSADLAAPLWARHAASIAAEEFQRRARMEDYRADATAIQQQNEQEP